MSDYFEVTRTCRRTPCGSWAAMEIVNGRLVRVRKCASPLWAPWDWLLFESLKTDPLTSTDQPKEDDHDA